MPDKVLTENEIKELKAKVPCFRDIFPPDISGVYDNDLVKLLGEANRAIGNLNSSEKIIPNPDLLVGPVLLKEALASSEIEGTRTTIRDVVQEEANIIIEDEYERSQAREVVNHIKTTRFALDNVEKLSLSSRLFKEMHRVLMYKVRGERKTVGDFRIGLNAVEREDKIVYIPPEATRVSGLFSDLEKYINVPQLPQKYDPLLRAAITHYQFEAIHPFADGNGRLGRVLISLQLIQEQVLRYPVLYLSGFLLREKRKYDDCLLKVTTDGDWKGWIVFFLEGVKEQATRSEEIVDKIYQLYGNTREHAKSAIRSPNIDDLITLIFTKKTITANDVVENLGLSHTASMDLLRKLETIKILSVKPENQRNIHFLNEPLIHLLEEV